MDSPPPLLATLRRSSFAKLNLTRNPFGELPRKERAELAVVHVEPFVDHLRGPASSALQLVADHGRGKSTHLIALHARHFPNAAFVQLHGGDPPPSFTAGPEPCFVDSIENLSRRERARLFALRRPIAFTTHVDLSREVAKRGRNLVTHWVGIEDVPDLAAIVNARIAAARRGTGELPTVSASVLADLLRVHGNDIRAIESQLFDEFERRRRCATPPQQAQQLVSFQHG